MAAIAAPKLFTGVARFTMSQRATVERLARATPFIATPSSQGMAGSKPVQPKVRRKMLGHQTAERAEAYDAERRRIVVIALRQEPNSAVLRTDGLLLGSTAGTQRLKDDETPLR